uniref:Uncharacterized mitochondrial protein AtMg00860-like n=1 Tax=Nicotiana tabacum TaxID=4097 RepID=A0A1S4D9B8_TOBAC|nr:PREDICTED: uncharacterized mitochondrial protein AtMg00860-like [Nicotiana tabacum]
MGIAANVSSRIDLVLAQERGQGSVAFLGHVVSVEGIKVYPKKIEAVQNGPRPTSAREIQSFLGLAGYYHRFKEGFSSIVAPLTRLTPKDAPIRWSYEYELIF